MNIIASLILVALVAILITLLVSPSIRASSALYFANIGEGTHAGKITKRADGAYGRHLLVKFGSDVNHVALCGVGDVAIGIIDDESDAMDDPLNVNLLGSSDETRLVQAAAAIAFGDLLVAGANGQARTLPGTTGTYNIIGRALNAAAAQGDLVEIDPTFPIQRVFA